MIEVLNSSQNFGANNVTKYSPEMIHFVRDKINELDDFQKVVLSLRFWENFSLTEISEHLHLSYKKIDECFEKSLSDLRLKILNEFENQKSI